jgi:5-hydroxyisourate hydrolase
LRGPPAAFDAVVFVFAIVKCQQDARHIVNILSAAWQGASVAVRAFDAKRARGEQASGVSTILKILVDKFEPRGHDGTFSRRTEMGKLTTHVLDTAQGKPGHGVVLTVFRVDGEQRRQVAAATTNADGRTGSPLLEGDTFSTGVYEILFAVGEYFQRSGQRLPEPPFVGDVVLRFGVADANAHYHVPLLVSPWSYSTYRGS